MLAHPDEAIEALRLAPRRAAFRLAPRLMPHTWRPHTLRFLAHGTAAGFLAPTGPLPPRLPVRRDRRAFSGDALVTLDVLTGRRGPRLQPPALSVDAERARAGARAEVDADLVLPGHRNPFAGSPAKRSRRRSPRAAERHRPPTRGDRPAPERSGPSSLAPRGHDAKHDLMLGSTPGLMEGLTLTA